MKVIMITGADGFIARHLAQTLKNDAYHTIGTARQPGSIQGFDQVYIASLGESLAPVFEQEKVDAVVHCANASGKDEYRVNVEGTSLWMEEARQNGISLQIFLSSLSAKPEALSDYGKGKYTLEQRFISTGQVVFKLGLVVGNGGMFGRLVQSIRRSKIVPLLDGGRTHTYILGIDFLCGVIGKCIRDRGETMRGRPWFLQQPEPYSLREVMLAIKRHYRFSNLLVPVPALPVLWLVLLSERLHWFDLPITSANIKGLIQGRRETLPSDFSYFSYPLESLDDLVANASHLATS